MCEKWSHSAAGRPSHPGQAPRRTRPGPARWSSPASCAPMGQPTPTRLDHRPQASSSTQPRRKASHPPRPSKRGRPLRGPSESEGCPLRASGSRRPRRFHRSRCRRGRRAPRSSSEGSRRTDPAARPATLLLDAHVRRARRSTSYRPSRRAGAGCCRQGSGTARARRQRASPTSRDRERPGPRPSGEWALRGSDPHRHCGGRRTQSRPRLALASRPASGPPGALPRGWGRMGASM